MPNNPAAVNAGILQLQIQRRTVQEYRLNNTQYQTLHTRVAHVTPIALVAHGIPARSFRVCTMDDTTSISVE